MKLSQQSLSTIESAIQKAAGKYVCGCDQTAVTDIHLQPDQTSGQCRAQPEKYPLQNERCRRLR